MKAAKIYLLIVIFFALFQCVRGQYGASIGYTNTKIDNESLFIFSFDIDNMYMYIGSNGTTGEGERSNSRRNNIPKSAVKTDKKLINTYGIGYNINVSESFIFTPTLGLYLEGDIYERDNGNIQTWYNKHVNAFYDLGFLARYKIDNCIVSVGCGTKTNLSLSVGVNF